MDREQDKDSQRILWIANGSAVLFCAWFLVANLRSVMLETGAGPAPGAPIPLLSVGGGMEIPDGPLPPGVASPRAALPGHLVGDPVPTPDRSPRALPGHLVPAPDPSPGSPPARVSPPSTEVPALPAPGSLQVASSTASAIPVPGLSEAPSSPPALPEAPNSPPASSQPAPPPRVSGPPSGLAPLRISPARPARLRFAGVEGLEGGYGLRLAFDRPVILRTTFKAGPRVLELTLFPVEREGLAGRLPPLAFLKSVTDVGAGRKAQLRIQLQGDYQPRRPLPAGEAEEFLLEFERGAEGPGLPPGAQLSRLQRQEVVTGLYEERYRYKPAGAGGSDVYLLEVDPTSPEIALDLAYGKSRILGKERVSSMARSLGALAAVNASFFSKNGDPLGLLARDGNLVSMPILSRGVLGVFDGGAQLLIGNPGFSGRFEFPGGSLDLDGVNQVRKPGKVLLYTPEWGERTGNPGGGLEIAVRRGRVEGVADGNIEIPRDGYVVAVEGGEEASSLSSIAMGAEVETVAGMTPPWNRVDFAVGGGPVLIRRGRVRVEWREESFSRSLVVAKAPRTGVGVRGDGKLVMVVVDGRRKGVNRGVDLYEFADILAELGCRDALNLDGGGSSTMVRDGKVLNRPSDGSERRVSTAIVIKPAPRPALYAGSASGLLEGAL